MAITRQGGPGIGLDTRPLTGLNNQIALASGETFTIPAGQFYVNPGPYTFLQVQDPITGLWLPNEVNSYGKSFVNSDGANVRLANLTGCPIGAVVTNAGSGYTSAPTVTASAGGSTWRAIVGGAVNTTVTITAGGTGWNFPPQLVFAAPPAGGVPATGTCTISGGIINAVVVTNQGAGYTSAPAITIVPDPREALQTTPGPLTAATLTAALTGANTITAVLCTGQGQGLQTATPTLAFSGGGGASAAATVIMCYTATGGTANGITFTNAGAVYGNAQPYAIQTFGGFQTATPIYVNPNIQGSGLSWVRPGMWTGTSQAGGTLVATGINQIDGGMYQAAPSAFVLASGTAALPTTLAIATVSVGGVSDTSLVQPF